tara:strand:- start:269 stop:508 length:240 start_codon:yes stop_codon:yes gene_type:complete
MEKPKKTLYPHDLKILETLFGPVIQAADHEVYDIDYEKVQTIEDVTNILRMLKIQFTFDDSVRDQKRFNKYKHFLTKKN